MVLPRGHVVPRLREPINGAPRWRRLVADVQGLHECLRSREFRRDPKIASAETEDNTETLVEILRNPPRMPFAVYVEIDCWNWDMAKATKTVARHPLVPRRGVRVPATAAGLCRGADGELLGGGSTSTFAALTALTREWEWEWWPAITPFAPPPVYFGAAAVAESAAAVVQAARESAAAVVHAALLESPLSEAAKAAAAKAAAAATNGVMPPVTIPATITSSKPVEGLTVDIGDGKEEADGNGEGDGGKKEHRLAARGGEDAEEQGEEEAEAEDVYVPLDVLHSGPINAKQPGDDSEWWGGGRACAGSCTCTSSSASSTTATARGSKRRGGADCRRDARPPRRRRDGRRLPFASCR